MNKEESAPAVRPGAGDADNVIIICPTKGFSALKVRDLWEYRELVYFLMWRDIKVRYKQTVIGAAWVILQPFLTMILFTIIFGIFVKIPSEGVPYAIFAYTGLLPWNFFSEAIGRGSMSLVASANLISKVYFPRLIIPISAVITPILDFALAFFILLGLMAWFKIVPTWGVLAVPCFLLLTIATGLAVSLWFSALNVKYRDVAYTIPFVVQFGMFASPVIYPSSLIPGKWRLIYCLNPMASVIDGFRWALLGKGHLDPLHMSISICSLAFLFASGLFYFKRMERTFADVI
jgi:lipopolysaccharide transport system permease protein